MGRIWAFLVLGLLTASSSWAIQVHDVRLWRAPDHTRIVFDLSGPADHRLLVLEKPDRIVLDLEDASLKANLDTLQLAKTPVVRIRSGVRGSGIVLHILAIPDRPARDERNGSKGEHKGEIFHCAASG